MPTRLSRAAWALLATLAAACSDQPGAPPPATDALKDVVVSATRGLDARPMAYVSLSREALAVGSEVVVTNRATGQRVRRAIVEGGFDPLGIPAGAGEQILIEIDNGESALKMPARMPPVVIRTEPAPRRPSVPLNVTMMVVFSEPMDAATLTGATVRLVGPAGQEAVDIALAEGGTVMEIRPRAQLRPSSAYRLELATGIADVTGQSLDGAAAVEFATEDCPTLAGNYVVRLLPDTLRVPVGALSGFVVAVDSGRRVINVMPDTSLTFASTDTTIVRMLGSLVDGVAMGRAWVTVTYKGYLDSALVIVTDWPPPAPFGLWPGGAVMPIGHVQAFEVSHPEGSPPYTVTWSVSDPAIIAVDASGNVTGLAAGTAWVFARSGSLVDSADVEVYDPAPRLGQLYVIRPDSVLFQVGDRIYLNIVGPEFPAPAVTWTVANPAVASVDQYNQIHALALGRTTITAHFADGSERTAAVIVVPVGTLGAITLSPLAPTVRVGETLRFNLTLDARAQELWGSEGQGWSLAGAALRMVMHEAGAFTAVQPGTATVRAYVGPLVAETVVTVVP